MNGLESIPKDPDLALRNAKLGAEHRVVGCMLEYVDLTGNALLRTEALGPGLSKKQLAFGRMYAQGGVWGKKVDRAIELFEAARRQQPLIGCYELGQLLVRERPARRDDGIGLLRQGAAAGNPDCCAFLGRCLRIGAFPETHPGEAISVLEKAAPLRHSPSLIELGKVHLKNGSPTSQVYTFFKRAYETGSARGAKWYAKCLQNGWGITPDPQKAAQLMAEVPQKEKSEDPNVAILLNTIIFYGTL
jgi:TPR repeat protein